MAVRVLIVLTSNDRRGAEVEGSQLAAQLTAVGFAADVVALRGGSADPLDVPALGARPLSPTVLRALRRRAGESDVVVAFGSTTLPACALALLGTRTPFVYRSIGDPAQWAGGRLHRWRTARFFARAAHVVALWPAGAAAITRLYDVSADAASCIPNARSAPERSPDRAGARARFDLPLDASVVAWVGAMSDEKRPSLAVDAVAATPECWLLMAGEGALANDVRVACVHSLPHRHRMIGVVTPLDAVWDAADVVLLTSSTEGMPGVLIEAALHGVPAVATDVGAVSSLIADGATGRVVPADAAPALVAAALVETIERRAEWEGAVVAHASAFTWPKVLPLWVALLGRVGKTDR